MCKRRLEYFSPLVMCSPWPSPVLSTEHSQKAMDYDDVRNMAPGEFLLWVNTNFNEAISLARRWSSICKNPNSQHS